MKANVVLLLVVTAAFCGTARAADGEKPQPQTPAQRDPTQLSPRLRQALAPKDQPAQIAPAPAVTAPALTLKGVVAGEKGASAAIAVANGPAYLVHADSEFNAGGVVAKVKSITTEGVVIEFPALRQSVTLH